MRADTINCGAGRRPISSQVHSTKPMVEQIRYFKVALKGIDAMSATTSRTYPRHTHDQYGIGVIDSGGHASLSGRGQVEAGSGSLRFVNPGEVHVARSLGGR